MNLHVQILFKKLEKSKNCYGISRLGHVIVFRVIYGIVNIPVKYEKPRNTYAPRILAVI